MNRKRRFIILNKEDQSYCNNGATGYCKIEIRQDKSLVKVFAQGLKSLNEGQKYKIYLMCNNKKFVPVYLGDVLQNKKEINFKVDTENVFNTGIDISDFNIVAICVEDSTDTYFPLVGYDNIEKTNTWRENLISHLKYQKNEFYAEKTKQQENYNPEMEEVEDKVEPVQDEQPEQNEQVEQQDTNSYQFSHFKQKEDVKQEEKSINIPNQNTNRTQKQNNYLRHLKESNFEKIKEIMNSAKGVSEVDPFAKAKLKYKWWKIKNLKFLEDIFKSSTVSNQIFKHPLIKKKLRETDHCLYGIISDVNDKIKYIAFGFPARYSSKDQIYFGGFAVFYPAPGNSKRNGDFGYWVVHIKVDGQNIVMTL